MYLSVRHHELAVSRIVAELDTFHDRSEIRISFIHQDEIGAPQYGYTHMALSMEQAATLLYELESAIRQHADNQEANNVA